MLPFWLQTRNLLRIALFNITYIRGLFPDEYFEDKDVKSLGIKVKKLKPQDEESTRLIDWMEQGVYDAMKQHYLRQLVFAISDFQANDEELILEEYSFGFSYAGEKVVMDIGQAQNKAASFLNNLNTPDLVKKAACKMIRTLVQLMRTLEEIPADRYLVMRMFYYDDVTPADYEPPFFKAASDEDRNAKFAKPPLSMKVGKVDSGHFAIALKVQSVLDPCEDEPNTAVDPMDIAGVTDQSNDNASSDSDATTQGGSTSPQAVTAAATSQGQATSEAAADINAEAHEPEKDDVITPNVSVRRALFTEKHSEALVKYAANPEDHQYLLALQYTINCESITRAELQSKLGPGADVRAILKRMETDGFVSDGRTGGRKGRAVIRDEHTQQRLHQVVESLARCSIKQTVATREDQQMASNAGGGKQPISPVVTHTTEGAHPKHATHSKYLNDTVPWQLCTSTLQLHLSIYKFC
eukprot:jgi/Chlat1/1863/Chrsp141S02180